VQPLVIVGAQLDLDLDVFRAGRSDAHDNPGDGVIGVARCDLIAVPYVEGAVVAEALDVSSPTSTPRNPRLEGVRSSFVGVVVGTQRRLRLPHRVVTPCGRPISRE
jgi:hypothetical protein